MTRPVPDFLEADVQVEDNLKLAAKAMESGKFEKAIAYTLLAIAWQSERQRAEARMNG
jgi:hypothetical protein